MASPYSARVLAGVLNTDLEVAAIVIPALPAAPQPFEAVAPLVAGPRLLPMRGQQPDIVALAQDRGVPLYRVATLTNARVHASLMGLHADAYCVACFPWRLPGRLLAAAAQGGLNAHPSLLPSGRGPAPRFWAFRRALVRSGVTVHRMTSALDAGPIVRQAAFDVVLGMTGAEFDDRAGDLAARLLALAVHDLVTGQAANIEQDERDATYDRLPTADDYVAPTDGPAETAYRFVAGVAGDGGPLTVELDGRRYPIREAVSYTGSEVLGAAWQRRDDVLWIQCYPGTLAVRLSEPAQLGLKPAPAGAPRSAEGSDEPVAAAGHCGA